MLARPIITLTTDFRLNDPFVGIMKGVILGINPVAHIIDLSHNMTPYNVLEASQIISMSYKYFPPTTIHVAVVDPGVGGSRRPILVVTEDYYFVGPDNGIFTPIFEEPHTNIFKVLHVTSSHYYLPLSRRIGTTFHGRDIFAPVAAWLSKGVESSKFGEEIRDYVRLKMPELTSISENTLEGEVIYIDNFGNAITNITQVKIGELSPDLSMGKLKIVYKGQEIALARYYSESGGSEISAILNSSGLLELFIYKGNVCDRFGVKIGDKVRVMVV